jgi:hypothetical protein
VQEWQGKCAPEISSPFTSGRVVHVLDRVPAGSPNGCRSAHVFQDGSLPDFSWTATLLHG